MKTIWKIWQFPVICLTVLQALGCSVRPESVTFVPASDFEPVRGADSVARRFQGDGAYNPTELESAI